MVDCMDPKERIILALDVSDHEEAIDTVRRFQEYVSIFKVGYELFTSVGPKIVRDIHDAGSRVFLDLKYHDIPNTVSRAARISAELGVWMFNVHTLGGSEMMKRAADELVKMSLKNNVDRPKILGVTILTSISQEILRDEIGIGHRMSTQVKHLAKLALNSGLDGVIASPQDIELVRAHCGTGFLIVTPGIRPAWAGLDDQKRTMTPGEAIRKGADYIVVGRAVTGQSNPEKAMERIQQEIHRYS